MLIKHSRRDWFPIVATDLFCGVLGAVIILDAVAPKEIGAAGEVALVEVSYQKQQKDDCTSSGVIFTFEDNTGHMFNSLDDGNSIGMQVGDKCVMQALFPDVVIDGPLQHPAVLVTEYATVTAPQVEIRGPGFPTLQCFPASPECPVR